MLSSNLGLEFCFLFTYRIVDDSILQAQHCHRTLGSKRHQHAIARPDKFGANPIAVGGIYVKAFVESGRISVTNVCCVFSSH